MAFPATQNKDYIVLGPDDYRTLGPQDFGSAGLTAVESIGPFVDIKVSGPLLTIHDSTIEPHLGIGHHPHRRNERIFYMESGQLDHSDSRNDITGHLEPGDLGLFTEGEAGMLHSEWNNGDRPSRIYILVYATDPVPDQAAFNALRDADAPRYQEVEGVHTKQMVGPDSPLQVHGDIRFFADSTLAEGAPLTLSTGETEGGLFAVREGTVGLDGHEVGPGGTILLPPADHARDVTVHAKGPSRVIRVVHGPGFGFRTK
ncbi:MAG: pirin family protein [Dehalococcoidia bacterium]|nr:pirin family protein [Dehalococcoidia bacterium]